MTELFREEDSAIIGYYQSILESEGIKTFIKNKDATNITGIPIPEFYPALCVVNNDDKKKALEILISYFAKNKKKTNLANWICKNCKEENPGNFEICWNCEIANV